MSHGIAVTADQKILLVKSRLNSALYAYSLPDLTLLGGAALSGKGAGWLTVTPDDKTAYVANEHTNEVSVFDIKVPEGGGSYPGRFRAGTEHQVAAALKHPRTRGGVSARSYQARGEAPLIPTFSAEVGFTRLRPLHRWPNSGKPEFSAGVEKEPVVPVA
jgi:hypothetical protein